MDYREIGNSGIKVSSICLGTMNFSNPVSDEDSIKMLHWALDHGINFIDTADIYEGYDRVLGSPGGKAESIIGDGLKEKRKQAIITTKVGNSVGGSSYEGAGLGEKHITHQINASLKRMQTDYVDIYELHKPDPESIKLAVRKLGVTADEALMIGDSTADIGAANAAGCWSCHAVWAGTPPGPPLEGIRPDFVAEKPSQVLQILGIVD